jgi:hypothetical protein
LTLFRSLLLALLPACGLDTFGLPPDSGGSGASTTHSMATDDGGSPTGEGSAPSGSAGDDSDGTKTDLGAQPDFGVPCDGGDHGLEHIWIPNSQQGTISKIQVETLIERGRYWVRPDSAGDPSRTSVNLAGDVVVASRSGGLTKFYAHVEDCQESNGMPGIQTSVDENILPWDQEECRAWYVPLSYFSQRPVAWTQGIYNDAACAFEEQQVWTSGNNLQNGSVDVLIVDGDTGAGVGNALVSGLTADIYGVYGAAVDKDGNFWGTQRGEGQLVQVNRLSLEYKVWPTPASSYGMTVDANGYVWTCAAAVGRFDPMTETWQLVGDAGDAGGCMDDGHGTLYKSDPGGIMAIDTETLSIKQTYKMPQHVHGISVDPYGQVWGVSQGAEAYRLSPGDETFETFVGLVGAYPYSHMTRPYPAP